MLRAAPETTRLYIADGTGGADFPDFLRALHPTRILSPPTLPPLLGPPAFAANGALIVHALANPGNHPVLAETASGAVLARQNFDAAGNAIISLPPSLQNRIARLALAGSQTAGGTALTDSALHTTLAGLDTRSANAETPYLGTLYYLRRALPASARTRHRHAGALARRPCRPDLPRRHAALRRRAGRGKALYRGGRRAGALRRTADRRPAGRCRRRPAIERRPQARRRADLEQHPKPLAPFPAASPFAGLTRDAKITVSQQILADPTQLDPATVWASLRTARR